MLDLLRIEWMKIKSYKAFIILGIFFILGIITANYIVYSVFANVVNESDAKMIISETNPYDFKYVWQTTSYTSGFLLIMPAMLLIILVTNEYTFKTNRQNIINGWSRANFIDVKLLLALVFALVATLAVIITGFVFGWASRTAISFEGFTHVLYFFLKTLSYNLFAILFSVMIKKTGFAIGAFFVYLGAENILAQMLDVLSLKIKKDTSYDLGSMGDYLPMNSADGLLSFPNNSLKKLAANSLPTNYTNVVIGLALVYLICYVLLSRNRVIKKDL